MEPRVVSRTTCGVGPELAFIVDGMIRVSKSLSLVEVELMFIEPYLDGSSLKLFEKDSREA